MNPVPGRIWIQGAGELASGVAWRLARCRYQVMMAEIANPLAVRRLVSFSEAVYEGRAEVEGITGVLVENPDFNAIGNQVRVLVDPEARFLPAFAPVAVVDARMTKRTPLPLPLTGVPVIGLGPGFRCPENAEMVVETHRGARLGELLRQGEAVANTGIPGLVGGQSARRVVYSPAAGNLKPRVQIGDLVSEGQILGEVASEPVICPLSGMVRGLVHPKAELSAGEKVGDVDPRGELTQPNRVTDKALAVAGGVLEGLLSSGIDPAPLQP